MNETIKVIFLDVDGVLNNDKTTVKTKNGFDFVDDYLLERLKKIVKQTSAKIVLSSDWRFDRFTDDASDYKELKAALEKNETPIYAHTGRAKILRGSEILDWFNNWCGTPIANFVIIDDLPANSFNFSQLKGHFVHTNYRVGLEEEDVQKAIEILNNPELMLNENMEENNV